jgi:phosphatidate cytidylyltransferase
MARARLEPLTELAPLPLARELAYVFGFTLLVALLALAARRFLRAGPLRFWERAVLSTWIAFGLVGLLPFDAVYGTRGIVALIVLSKVGDIAGYFVGRSIGKSHPFPRISPGKTTAGCVASFVVGSGAGAAVVASGLVEATIVGGLAVGALTNLAAQAGDLFESACKRRAGVKDSSPLLGAAGGVLDVVDSLLFTVPFALFVWPLCFSAA